MVWLRITSTFFWTREVCNSSEISLLQQLEKSKVQHFAEDFLHKSLGNFFAGGIGQFFAGKFGQFFAGERFFAGEFGQFFLQERDFWQERDSIATCWSG